MNKTATFLIILFVIFAVILLALGLYLLNPKGIFKKTGTVTSETNPQIEAIVKGDTYNDMTNTGVRPSLADNQTLEIAGTVKSINKTTLVLKTLTKEYTLPVTEDMQVLIIDEKLQGQAQLDKLTSQSISELKVGEQITASCVINEGNVLSVVGLRKNIR